MKEAEKMYCPHCGNYTFKRSGKYNPIVEIIKYGNDLETEVIEFDKNDDFNGWSDNTVWCMQCEANIDVNDLIDKDEKEEKKL